MSASNVTKAEIQGIFARDAESYLQRYPTNSQQRKAMNAIINCRGPRLGRHIDQCTHCGHMEISYNSCRNRHCPKCQQSKQMEWVNYIKSSLLPVRYFHLVFTVPGALNNLIYKYQKQIYPMLFKASAQAVLQVAARPGFLGAQSGCLSILHTWGQNLQYHPHIHMLVPAGGMSEDQMEWISSGKKFFVPVRVLSKVFRGKLVAMLEELNSKENLNFEELKPILYKKDWVVYSKKSFAGPAQVLSYLGRYTHRVAISNSRIISHRQGKVCFRWKDYRDKASWKTMQLESLEFIRRFLLHVLPTGFCKIRYYGIFSLAYRKEAITRCISLLPRKSIVNVPNSKKKESDTNSKTQRKCPICHLGEMLFYKVLSPTVNSG